MDAFSVEITPDGERLDIWIPEIGCGTRAQFDDEVDLVARNLLYIFTGRPRKSYELQFDWCDIEEKEKPAPARGGSVQGPATSRGSFG